MADSTEPSKSFSRICGGEEGELTVCKDDAPAETPVQPVAAPFFQTNEDLPEDIRQGLPTHIQTLYRQVYNRVWADYVMPVRRGFLNRHDDVARRKAWAAVKRQYVKTERGWERRRP